MGPALKIADVVKRAYAMPLTNPSFPPGPYRFFNREYVIITYRTTREALEAVVPEPLEIDEPLVKYEFIRMPDSTGFGDYTETGQVIPVRYKGQHGGYVHSMYLDDVLCATGTMGYKHREADHDSVLASLASPNFLIKIIPHVDGSPRICELVRYYLTDVTLKEAWTAPAALDLRPHVMADVARLPVLDIVSAVHFTADLTLGLGEVMHDYLADHSRPTTSAPQLEKARA